MRRVIVHPSCTPSSTTVQGGLSKGLAKVSSTACQVSTVTCSVSATAAVTNSSKGSAPLEKRARFGSFDVEHALTPIGAISNTRASTTANKNSNLQQQGVSSASTYRVRYPWSPDTFDKAWRENRCLLIRVYSGPVPSSDCISPSSHSKDESYDTVISDVLNVAGGVMVVGIDASCTDPIFLPENSAFTSSSTPQNSEEITSPTSTSESSPSLYQQLRDYLENQRELYTPRQVSRMLINAVETDYATEMLPPGDSTERARLHRTLYGPERRILRGGDTRGRDIDGGINSEEEGVSELFRIVITPSGSVVQGWFVGSMGTVLDEADYHKSSKSSSSNSHTSSANNNSNPSLGNSKLRQELLGPAVQIGDASVANTDESFAVDRMLVEESCSLLHTGYLQPDFTNAEHDKLSTSNGAALHTISNSTPQHQHQWSVEDNITRFFERKWGYQSLSKALSFLEDAPTTTSSATLSESLSVENDLSSQAKERAALERIGTLYSKWCCNNELAALSNFRIRGQTDLQDFGSLDNCMYRFESSSQSDDAIALSPTLSSSSASTPLGSRLESILNVEADPAGLLETADVHMIFRARQHAKLGGLSYRAAAFDVVDADGFTMYRPDIVAGKTTLVAGLRAGLTVFKDRSYGYITQLAPPLVAASAPTPVPDAAPCMMQPCVQSPTTVSAMLDLSQPLVTSYTTAVPLQSSLSKQSHFVVEYVLPAHTYLSSTDRLKLLRHIPVTLIILRLTDLQNQQEPSSTTSVAAPSCKKKSKKVVDTTVAVNNASPSPSTRTLLILPTPIPPQMELTTVADVLLLTFTRVLVHSGSWQRVSGSSTAFASSTEDYTPGSAGTTGGSRPGARDVGASSPGEVGSGPKTSDGDNKRGGRVPLSVTSKGDVRGGGILIGDEMDSTNNNINTNDSTSTTAAMPSVLLRREPDECLSLLYHAFSHSRHRCEVGMGMGGAYAKALSASNLTPKKDSGLTVISQGIDPMTIVSALSSTATTHQRDNAFQIVSEITADFVRLCRTSSMMLAVDMLLRQTDSATGTTPHMPSTTEAETATANVVKLLKRKQDETQNRRRHGGRDKEKKGGGRINSRKALANALKIMNRRQGGDGEDGTNIGAAAIVRSKLNDCIPEEHFFEDVRTFVQEAAEWVVYSVDTPAASTTATTRSFSDRLDPLVHLSNLFHNPSLAQKDVTAGLALPEEAAQLQQNIIDMLTNLKMTLLRYERAHKMIYSGNLDEEDMDMAEEVYPAFMLPTIQRAYVRVDTSLTHWMQYNGTVTESSTLLLSSSPSTSTATALSSDIIVSPISNQGVTSSSLTKSYQDMYNFNNPWGSATNVHLGTHRAVCEMLNAPYFSNANLALSVQNYLNSVSTTFNDNSDSILVAEASIDPLQLLAEGYSQRYLYQTVGNRTALEQALFRYRYAGSDDQYCFERAMKVLPQPMSEVLPRYRTSLLSDLNTTSASGSSSFLNGDGEIEEDPVVISRRADSKRAKELASLLRGDNADDYVDEVPKGLSHQGGALGLLADREASGNGGDIMKARGKGSALDSPFEASPDPLVAGLGIQFSFSGKGATDDDTPAEDVVVGNSTTTKPFADNAVERNANHIPIDIVSIVDDIHNVSSKYHHRSSDLDRQRVVSLYRQLSLVSTTGRSFRWGSIADSPIVFSTPYDPVSIQSVRNNALAVSQDASVSGSIISDWYTTPSTYRRRRRILPYALTNQTFGIRPRQPQSNTQPEVAASTTSPTSNVAVQETAKQRFSEQVRQLLCSGVAALPQGLLVPSYSNVPDYEGESSMAASSIQSIRFPSFRVREAPALAVESVVKNVPYLLPPPMLAHHGRRENNNNNKSITTNNNPHSPPSRHIPRWASTSQLGLESYVWTRRVALGFEGRYVYSTLLRVMVKEAVNNAKLGLCFKTSSVTGRSLPPEVKTASFYKRISSPPSWASPAITPTSTTSNATETSLVPYDVQSVTVLPQSAGMSLSAGNHTEGWLEIKRAANALSMHSTLVVSCLVLRRLKLIPVSSFSTSETPASTKKKSIKKNDNGSVGIGKETNSGAFTYISIIHPSTGDTVKVRIPKSPATAASSSSSSSSPLAALLLSSHLGTAAATIASVYKNYVPAVVTCDPLGVLGAIQSATASTPSGPVTGLRGPEHFGLVCEEILGNAPPGTAAIAVRNHQQLLRQQQGDSSDITTDASYDQEAQYDSATPSANNSALLFAMTDKLQRKFEKAKKSFGSDYEDSGRGGTEPAPHSLATLPDPVRDQVNSPKNTPDGWTPNIASSKSPANLSQSMTSDGMHMEAAFIVAENRQSGGLRSLKTAASALISAEDDSRLDEDFMCAPAAVTEPILLAVNKANDLLYTNSSSIMDDETDGDSPLDGAFGDPVDNGSLTADRPAVDSSHLQSTANYYKGLTKIHTQRGEDGGDADDGSGASPWSRVPKSIHIDEIYGSLDDDEATTASTPSADCTPTALSAVTDTPPLTATSSTIPTTTVTDATTSFSLSANPHQNHFDTSRDHPLERLATGLRDVVVPYEHLLQMACVNTTTETYKKHLHQLSASPSFANGRKEMDFEQLPLNLLSTSAALDLGAFNISDFTDVARELASWMTREELATLVPTPVASSSKKSGKNTKKSKQTTVEEDAVMAVYDLSVEEVAVVFKGAMYLPSVAYTETQLLELLMFS